MKTLLKSIIFTVFISINLAAFAQVGINTNTPEASAALDITSSSGGLLVPRITAIQRDAITTPSQGLIIFCTDCASGEGELQISLTSAWKNLTVSDVNDPPPPQVGDLYLGGIVFYILQSGDSGYVEGETHGLVCALSDYGLVEWGCHGTDILNIPNVTSSPPTGAGAEIGDGVTNTDNLLADCPNPPAVLAARTLGPDWFIPSVNELILMYENKTTINTSASANGGNPFIDNYYWSSTEFDMNSVWVKFLGNGHQTNYVKNNPYVLRAVRAF